MSKEGTKLSEINEAVGGQDAVDARIRDMEGRLAQKEAEITELQSKLGRLEAGLAGRDGEIASLKQAQAAASARLKETGDDLSRAVAGYRALVLQANPGVIGEMVSGESIDEIDRSLHKAKELVSRVKQGLESEIKLVRVPAGAPERTPPDLSGLSSREKIHYGIGGKK